MGSAGTRIQLCGRLAVTWDGEPLEDSLPGRQGRLLFAYLVLNRDRPVRRDELVEALWSQDGTPPSGDGLLAPPLSRLRKALGPGRLEGRTDLQLMLPADAQIDWEEARTALARARAAIDGGNPRAGWQPAQDALAITERGLLPGLEAGWIDDRRRELADLRIEALEAIALIGARLGRAESAVAEEAARAAVEAAPFRESAHAALMEALRARGNAAEALRAFEDVRVLLRDELGATPGPPLLALHERLLRAEAGDDPAPAVGATAGVLPPPAPGELPDRLAEAAGPSLVGRRAPLERLRAELSRVQEGASGLVLLAGEGGIGKTRLAAELAREADTFTVLYGRCDEEELFPFGPWIEMLGGHLERAPEADLIAVLGDDGADLARLLPELRLRLPDLPPPADTGADEGDRRRLFAAVVGVTRRLAARAPLLLVVDDLHWADRSSLLLLRQLVRAPQLGRVLIVGTYRDNELPPRHPLLELLGNLERDRSLPRLYLEGLDEDEVGALVGATSTGAAGAATIKAIRAETNGNPFFVKQLVRHLDEGGKPVDRPSGVRFGVPAGLRDVIAGRVARLPERAGTVLSVAALIGREFDLRVLEHVLADVPEDELLDVLDAAVHAGLLVEAANRPGRYSFAHALLRTTLEEELTTTRQARIHRRIGEAIEALHADHLDHWLVDLARHFRAAGPDEAARAVDYSARAADQAADRLAYEEAAQLTAAALEALERADPVDDAAKAKLLLEHSKSVWRLGHFQEARELCARAAESARRAGDVVTFAEAAFDHSGGAWERYGTEDPASVALLEEALELLPAEDSRLRAMVLAQLGEVLYYSSASEQRQLELVEQAIGMARRLGDDHALADCLNAALYAHWRPGRAELRLPYADELIAITARHGRLHFEADAQTWRAIALLELGRLDEAEAAIDRQAEIAERLEQSVLLVHGATMRSMRALLAGDWLAAERATAEMVAASERGEAIDVLQFLGAQMMVRLSVGGRLGELLPQLERLVRQVGGVPGWRAVHAWALVQAGRESDARAQIDDLGRDDFAIFPNDANRIPGLAVLAHVAVELRDAELAEALLPQLEPWTSGWVVVGPAAATLGPVAWSVGALHALSGDHGAAADHFDRALELSERMRAQPYVARSALGLAQALRAAARDPERVAELEKRALALARDLDMTRLLATAEPVRG